MVGQVMLTWNLDRIGAGLHSFKFIVKEFIDVACGRCIGFNFDSDTPNVSRTRHTQFRGYPHGEATLDDVLSSGRGRGRGLPCFGISLVTTVLLHPFFHPDIILTH